MRIPYGRQEITEDDIEAVVDILRSDFLTQGPTVPAFERAVAQYCGARYAIAVNSGTSALHIACLALGVGAGDLVFTTPITFVASANCALYCGAHVNFVDIDSLTYNLSSEQLATKLAEARGTGRTLPKVVIPVHLAGQPCDMAAIRALSEEYDFRIIEDASHAIGARYRGARIGDGRYSDITVFSFHPVKIITSGEGGMAVTNDPHLAERMAMLRSHGITRDPGKYPQTPSAPWYYEQQLLGYNYRMTDIHAALGISQLKRIDQYVERRNALAKRYDRALADLPLQLPAVHPESVSAFHLYVVRLKRRTLSRTYQHIFEELRQRGIGVNLHYMPVHLQPYYRELGFEPGQYPEAEEYAREAITLPLYPSLTEHQQDAVIEALRQALGGE